jgi:divalent metal cation (Fe/Co/Zn/Cd) transporter
VAPIARRISSCLGQRDPASAFPLAHVRDDACERRQAVTAFICHVGYEVTKDVVHRLADGGDLAVVTTAEAAAGSVPGVIHARARARWTGRTLRVEIEGWVDPELPAKDADALGRLVAGQISRQLPQAGSVTWTTRSAPA